MKRSLDLVFLLLLLLAACQGTDPKPGDTDVVGGDADTDTDADADADTDTDIPTTAPTAVDDAFTVDEGEQMARMEPLNNDTDPDDNIDVGTLTVVDEPLYGTVTARPDGNMGYSHDGGEEPTDSFTYTIADLDGQTSNIATIAITVNPVNDRPEAFDDAFNVDEGAIGILDLALNDTDADDGLNLASIQITNSPLNGAVVVNNDGTVDYTHDDSETINDGFTYTIDDNTGAASNQASVTLTINPVNDAPTAIDDLDGVVPGGVVTTYVSTNDTDPDDGLDLTSIAVVNQPTDGTLVVNVDGSIEYTHDNGPAVADSYTYTIDDVSGATSNVATVDLNINNLAQSFEIFTADQNYIVPAGVASIRALVVGGGGGGANGHQGGAGSGSVVMATIPVTPGELIAVVVGAGGFGALDCDGCNDIVGNTNGGDSSFAATVATGGVAPVVINGPGGDGGSGGGGSCNGGSPGGDGGTNGANGGACSYQGGNGLGDYGPLLTPFTRSALTAGTGGVGGTGSHAGGGGGGGVLIDGAGPSGQQGGRAYSGVGGDGYGGGGGGGSLDFGVDSMRVAGGDGASGVVYIELL